MNNFRYAHEETDTMVDVSWTTDDQFFYFGSVMFQKGEDPVKLEAKLDRGVATSTIAKFINGLVSNGYVPVENV